MRGEDDARFKDSYAAEETPPHAWGRHGYTPDIKTSEEKHPHMRGDARGKEPAGDYPSRNTPTCVGKTTIPVMMEFFRGKHPHMRGEDTWTVMLVLTTGKHPHMRGEDGHIGIRVLAIAETPPHAWGRHKYK